MKPNNVTIFGDSFADPQYNNDKHPDITPWYNLLKADYHVVNHALRGTGPHYSFKEYYNFIKSPDKKDHIVIFLLSSEDRIDYVGLDPYRSIIIKDLASYKEYSFGRARNDCPDEQEYYNTHKKEIDYLNITMKDELEWFNYKNLSFLYINSLFFGLKTIVFTTYTGQNPHRSSRTHYSFAQLSAKLNNSNFYLHPISLGYIANKEITDWKTNYARFSDYRLNHLSENNHKIMYDNINNIINNDKTIPFVENLYNISTIGNVTGFIYE